MKSMMTPHLCLILLSILSSTLAAATQPPRNQAPDTLPLSPQESRFFDEFLLSSQAQLTNYSHVYIAPAEVSFDKRWLREHRGKADRRYQQKTISRYAKMLENKLRKAFEKHPKYTLVDNKNQFPGTLVVHASLLDLDIYGPDTGLDVKRYVYRAGDATFELSLRSNDGTKVAYFKDHRNTRDRGGLRLERASRAFNQRDFGKLMERWCRKLVEHVDNVS